MSEGFWNGPPAPDYASPGAVKRPRPDFDAYPAVDNPSHGVVHYPQSQRNDGQLGVHVVKDTKAIEASYDRYLQTMVPSFASGAANLAGAVFPVFGEMSSAEGGKQVPEIEQQTRGVHGTFGPLLVADARPISFDGQVLADPINRQEPQAPAMQLPPDATGTLFVEGLPCNCTEREVARYKLDLQDPVSPYLRVQFARNPGPRSGPGSRGRR